MDNKENPPKLTVNSRLHTDLKVTGMDWSTTVPFESGPRAGTFQVVLICTDLPAGTQVSLTSDTKGPNPPIFIPDTVVATPRFVVGVISDIPANYMTTFTIRARFQSVPPRTANIYPMVTSIEP